MPDRLPRVLMIVATLVLGACGSSAPVRSAPDPDAGAPTTAAAADAWTAGGTVSTTLAACHGTMNGAPTTYPPTLVLIDASTGTIRWQFCPASPTNGLSAAMAGDTVVFASGVARPGAIDVGLAGFAADTGAIRWQQQREQPEFPSVVGRTVIVARQGLSAHTGVERWSLAPATDAALALDTPGTWTTYVLERSSTGVRAIDVATGTERWRTTELMEPRAASDATVLLSGQHGQTEQVIALDAADGAERWRADGMLVHATSTVALVAPTAGATTLDVRDATTGKVRWTFDRANEIQHGMTGTVRGQGWPDDVLIVAASTPGFTVYDTATGKVRWSRPDVGWPDAVGTDVMISHAGAAVLAVDARTGKDAWRLTLPCVGGTADATCSESSGYVQTWALRDGLLALAINDFNGT